MLIARNFVPYFMNAKGTGIARTAMPPNTLIAGPTPIPSSIGRAASGNPAAITLRSSVFALTALAAYTRYVSTRKLIAA